MMLALFSSCWRGWAALLVLLLQLASVIDIATASVTVVLDVEPRVYKGTKPVTSPKELFRLSCPNEFEEKLDFVLTSFGDINATHNIHPSSDSFVRGVVDAWAQHQNLVIRPDEVWFSILVQMNFYMNSHNEEIRHLFVDFEGKQMIHVKGYTWIEALAGFKYAIQERVKTDWLLDWIMPNFTTTTESDVMTANVLMMGLMQHYFDYTMSIICGIPSVTLLGEQKDWEALLAKLKRLDEFGPEPTLYRQRLQPILTRFVNTFKDPYSASTRDFWNQIVHADQGHMCGAPPYTLSGWAMGFYFWDAEGQPYGQGANANALTIDGVAYPSLPIDSLPIGYAQAPISLVDYNGMDLYPGYVVAGNLGKRITNGAPAGYAEALKHANVSKSVLAAAAQSKHSTLQPWSAWFLYGPKEVNSTTQKLKKGADLSNLSSAIGSNWAAQCASGRNMGEDFLAAL